MPGVLPPWAPPPNSGAGVTDHGDLTGLGDDDHPQYLTAAEGNAAYDITGAAAAAQAAAVQRANHTGTQAAASILFAATARVLGRITAGGGAGEELTAANLKTILALASTDLSDFTEAVQDVLGALGWGGSGLTVTYNDAANTVVLDVNVDGSTIEVSSDALRVKDAGITRAKLATALQNDVATVTLFNPTESWAVGDGAAYLRVPSTWDGLKVKSCALTVITVSSSGLPTVQIANVTQARDLLTTKLTVDVSETDSSTATTPAVIDTASSHDVLTTGDLLRFDPDVAGTGTKGGMVEIQVGP